MTTFQDVSEAWIVSREHCTGSLGRIQFWVDQFGSTPITDITEDDVDRARVRPDRKREEVGTIRKLGAHRCIILPISILMAEF